MKLPFQARLDSMRGVAPHFRKDFIHGKEKLERHLNRLIANNPNDVQQYVFASLAADTGLAPDFVRRCVSPGDSNGITLRVSAEDRKSLAHYLG